MRTLIIASLLVAGTTAFMGCETKAGTGTLVGAGAGGAIGGALGGTTGLILGGALGGVLGYGIGNEMDREDRIRAAQALEYDREMEWRNAQGEHYRVIPEQRTYVGNRECRNFRMLADVDGRPQEMTGTACRRPDGSWETISG